MTATVTSDVHQTEIVCRGYRARFRLITVVFDVWGWDPQSLHTASLDLDVAVSNGLETALLPLWPVQHPTIFWPPGTDLDEIGGIEGLGLIPVDTPPLVIRT